MFSHALAQDLPIMTRRLDRPSVFVVPVAGALAAVTLAVSVRLRQDALPFPVAALIFVAAFSTLAISFWPYMMPFAITIDDAAAPPSSSRFHVLGAGLFVFPLMLLYIAINDFVFRGKINLRAEHY